MCSSESVLRVFIGGSGVQSPLYEAWERYLYQLELLALNCKVEDTQLPTILKLHSVCMLLVHV